ncbi:MAG: phosphatase [Acidobacteria bacterium]|nr:MAG: phosphatase [Acidobacteriota bacterium]
MNIVRGDVLKLALEGEFDVIVHGCNCQCTMGAGIAKAIRKLFPEAYEADLATERGSRSKLGTYSSATVYRNAHEITVINAYTQFHYQGRGVKVDYEAIRLAFRAIARDFSGRRIAYPRIGAGLGGGDWGLISKILNQELANEDHTLVEFAP